MRIGLQLTGNPQKYQDLLALIRQHTADRNSLEFIHIADDSALQREIPDLEILVCYRITPQSFALAGPKLKWIHFGAAGIEHSLFPELVKSRVRITNARGIHAGPVSEFILSSMLYFAKQVSACREFTISQEWRQWDIAREMVQLKGRTLGIIGYGAIGKELARKAAAFRMNILATHRTAKEEKFVGSVRVIPLDKIRNLLSASDFVAVTCPLTPDTRGLLGKAELTMMKSSAILINVARGAIVDEKALNMALAEKTIGGAALDVFSTEPLPAGHPFFALDNVLLSPHVSGNFPEYQADVANQFAENLNRYLSGRRLFNRIGKKRLY